MKMNEKTAEAVLREWGMLERFERDKPRLLEQLRQRLAEPVLEPQDNRVPVRLLGAAGCSPKWKEVVEVHSPTWVGDCLEIAVTAFPEWEGQKAELILSGLRKTDGEPVAVAIPATVRHGAIRVAMPQAAVEKCPIDLESAVVVRVDVQPAPAGQEAVPKPVWWQQLAEALAVPQPQHLTFSPALVSLVRREGLRMEGKEAKAEPFEEECFSEDRRLRAWLRRDEDNQTLLTFTSHDPELNEALVWFGLVDHETGQRLHEGFAMLHPGLFDVQPTATLQFGPDFGVEKPSCLAFACVQPAALTAAHLDALRWSLSVAAEEPLRERLRELICQVEGKQEVL